MWAGIVLAMSYVGKRRRLTLIGLATTAILLLAIPARREIHGLTLVVRAADLHGVGRHISGSTSTAPRCRRHDHPCLHARIYVLHGRDDSVIPAAESQQLADRLRGHVPVRLLVTNLISHADADNRLT